MTGQQNTIRELNAAELQVVAGGLGADINANINNGPSGQGVVLHGAAGLLGSGDTSIDFGMRREGDND